MPAIADTPRVTLPKPVERRLRALPSGLLVLPSVALQAIELSEDPECSLSRFASIVERDARLTAEVLKLSNSIAYGGGTPAVCVHRALGRLGLKAATNLLLASCVSSLMQNVSLEDEWTRDSLARHGNLTASIATRLNRLLRLGFNGEEFTAGLTHDIGRLLLAVAYPQEFQQVDLLSFDEATNPEAAETAVLAVSHSEIGAWYAEENCFPEGLVDAVRFHHRPEEAGAHHRLATLIAAADHIANALQRGEDPARYELVANMSLTDLVESVDASISEHEDALHSMVSEIHRSMES